MICLSCSAPMARRPSPVGSASVLWYVICSYRIVHIGLFLPEGSPVFFKGICTKEHKTRRNTRSMAGEARNGHQPAFVAPFLLVIFDQEVHILAPSSSFKLPSGSLICCKLSIRDAAAAATMRIAKTLGFAGQGAHVVCMLAADACRMPSLAGFCTPP